MSLYAACQCAHQCHSVVPYVYQWLQVAEGSAGDSNLQPSLCVFGKPFGNQLCSHKQAVRRPTPLWGDLAEQLMA
jgi:hypothetical protein